MLPTAGQLIRQAWDLYKKNWRLFIQYALLIYGITAILIIGGAFVRYGLPLLVHAKIGIILTFLLLLFFGIITIVLSFWLALAFIRVVVKRYEGQKTRSIKEELRQVRPLLWSAILAWILTTLAIIGGFMLLVIPAFIFAVWFSFAFYEIAIEEKTGFEAMKASKQLVQNRWGAVVWRFIAPALVVFVAFFIILYFLDAGFSWIEHLHPTRFVMLELLKELIVQAAFATLFSPFILSAQAILYTALKKMPAPKMP